MRRKSFDGMACGIARALDVVGDAWTLLLVREAMFGTRTFEGFQRTLAIPRSTLAARLQELVDRGVLSVEADPADQRRKLYALEEAGRELWVVLLALQQWGNRWMFDDGPPSYMADRTKRRPVAELVPRDRSGTPLALEDVTMIPGPSATPALRARFRELASREH